MNTAIKRKERLQRAKLIRYYPLALNVRNRLAIVAGGGKVALMKVRSLLKSGACVHVISPELTSGLKRLYKRKRIKWTPRKIQPSDLKQAVIVIAATPEERVNKNISKWVKKSNALVNVVDQPNLSHYISPAVFRKKEALVAVYTNGISPSISRDLKNFLNEKWSEFRSYQKAVKKTKRKR